MRYLPPVKNNVSTERLSNLHLLSISALARPRSPVKTCRRMTPSSLRSSRQLVSLAYKKIQSYTRLRLGVVFLWVFRGSTSQPIWTSLAILLAPWIPSEGPHFDRELALNTTSFPALVGPTSEDAAASAERSRLHRSSDLYGRRNERMAGLCKSIKSHLRGAYTTATGDLMLYYDSELLVI